MRCISFIAVHKTYKISFAKTGDAKIILIQFSDKIGIFDN